MSDVMETATLVRARPDVVSSDLADGAALLDMRSSMYFSVNPVGAHMWAAMQQPVSVADLVASVSGAFAVSPEVCRPDILRMLETLRDRDLIEIDGA